MNSVSSRLRFVLHAIVLATALGALVPPAAGAEDIFPLKDVERGMKGEGKTVFQQTEIITFSFEVVDILRNWLPGQDVILVKCGGKEVEETGIASGMSGSPCYIDGKLLGALAYAWPWSREALAGITPIEAMMEIPRRPLEKKVEFPAGRGAQGLQPIKTPLFVSARSARAFAWLEKACEPYHLKPVGAGASGGAFADLDEELRPGSAVGVLLMEGDMEAYAVGTVTRVDGNRLLAFGHSFLQEGEYSLPITNAWTYTVVSMDPGSFKMSATGKVMGAMVQDRLTGVYARLDKKASLVPMTVTVRNPRIKTERTYSVRLARHKNFTPMMASFALSDALDAAEPGPGEVTQNVRLTFKPEGYDEVSIRMYYSMAGGWWGRNFTAPLSSFLNNEFEKVEVESISVDAEIVHEARTASLVGLKIDKREYLPGETAHFHVQIMPYRKKIFWHHFPYKIPENLEPGAYTVTLCPADEAPMAEERPLVEDIPTLLDALRALNLRRADQLVAVVNRPGLILQHKAERYRDLPLHILYTLLPPNESGGFRVESRYWKSEPQDVDYFLAGSRRIQIVVKKKAGGK